MQRDRQRPPIYSSCAYTHFYIYAHTYKQIYVNTDVCMYKVNQHSAFFNLIYLYLNKNLCFFVPAILLDKSSGKSG